MREFINALSNKVWLDENNRVIKRYNKDLFKSEYGNQEDKVLDKIGYDFKLEGNMLNMEYIESESFNDENISHDDLAKVANAVKHLHSLDTSGIELSSFEKVYEEFLSEDDEVINDYPVDGTEYDICLKAFDILESGQQVILHNDLVEGNLLKADDEIKLIDFEYSGLGNKIFDIASFITEREMKKADIDFFIDLFDDVNREDLFVVAKFLQIFWARWALYKYSISDKEIYKEIADWKFEQYLILNKKDEL